MLFNNNLYLENIKTTAEYNLNWDKLKNKTILLAGATGMIGTFLVDVIMYRNNNFCDNITIIAMSRNMTAAEKRFEAYMGSDKFHLLIQDITHPCCYNEKVDYIINCASNTHPLAYSLQPISTITTNILGTHNLLEFAVKHSVKRYLFVSSVEIYGENKGDTEYFTEDYCGYINCNTLRAGYPEAKRLCESLCQAYIKEKSMDSVIIRLPRVYGETMLSDDSKAMSQFIKKGIAKEDIVLKSKGNQFFSYIYTPDAVTAMLTALLEGKTGEAYNVSNENSDITLKSLAELIAELSETKVIFELSDDIERAGYSTATKALLDSSRIKTLGWTPNFDINSGLTRTLNILKNQ